MSLPKPAFRVATASDGGDGDTPSSMTGLRWSFVLQTPHTGSHLIVQTARSEHNQLKFKLPQVTRVRYFSKPEDTLREMLATPPFTVVGATDITLLGISASLRAFPPQGFREENVLEIIYVHAMLDTAQTFTNNDFLKWMNPQDLLEYCQSYRHAHYRRVLKLFGLLS